MLHIINHAFFQSLLFLAAGIAIVAGILGTILSFVKFGKVLFGEKKEMDIPYDLFSTAVILTLSGLCLITGILAMPMMYLVLGVELKIGMIGYIQKILIWIVSFVLLMLFIFIAKY